MNTQNDLIQKYGYFMTVGEVAEFLKIAPQTIYNRMSQRRFEIAAVARRKAHLTFQKVTLLPLTHQYRQILRLLRPNCARLVI